MRAEDTLQYMADFYHEIFPTRKHALDHLFCVIGNGYEWVNGELVDDDNKYEKRYKLRKHIKKAEFEHEEHWLRMHNWYRNVAEPIPNKYNFEWYPLSKKYSYLFDYPEDIKPDWLALIEECKQMLIEDGINLDEVK